MNTGSPATTPAMLPRRHAPPRQPSVASVAARTPPTSHVISVVRCKAIAAMTSAIASMTPRAADRRWRRSYAERARAKASSERAMARPPGSAQPPERALEAFAERGRSKRAAQLVVVGERRGDDVAIALGQRLERGDSRTHELVFFERNARVVRPAGGLTAAVCVFATALARAACRPRLPRRDRQRPRQSIAFAVESIELTEQPHERDV